MSDPTAKYIFHLENKVLSLRAKIDSLMLEYCPDEMTPEQIKNWENHQVRST